MSRLYLKATSDQSTKERTLRGHNYINVELLIGDKVKHKTIPIKLFFDEQSKKIKLSLFEKGMVWDISENE